MHLCQEETDREEGRGEHTPASRAAAGVVQVSSSASSVSMAAAGVASRRRRLRRATMSGWRPTILYSLFLSGSLESRSLACVWQRACSIDGDDAGSHCLGQGGRGVRSVAAARSPSAGAAAAGRGFGRAAVVKIKVTAVACVHCPRGWARGASISECTSTASATMLMAGSFSVTCAPIALSGTAALCAAVLLFSGVAIGATGIGGVLVVPMLGVALSLPIKVAIHATMAAYVVTGLVQTSLWAYKGSLAGRDAAVLCLASMPASLLAGLALPGTPAPLLTLLTALLASASGVDSLLKARRQHQPPPAASGAIKLLSPAEKQTAGARSSAARQGDIDRCSQAALGGIVGFGSAVTGTGGPFLLLPLLFLCRPQLPVLRCVGLAQALPLPIALSATAANAWFAEVDLCIAAQLAGCIAPAVPVGVWLAHRVDTHRLRVVVSALLVGIGGASLGQLAQRFVSDWLCRQHAASTGSGSSGSDAGSEGGSGSDEGLAQSAGSGPGLVAVGWWA